MTPFFSLIAAQSQIFHFLQCQLLARLAAVFAASVVSALVKSRRPLVLSSSRVRQFIEMVNGTDSEVRCLGGRSPKSQDSYPGSPRPFSPSHKTSGSQPYLPGKPLPPGHSHVRLPPSGCGALTAVCGPFSFFFSLGFDGNCCNGVASTKSHSASPHSHKPSPPGSGPTLATSDVSLNGSRSQLPVTRYLKTSAAGGGRSITLKMTRTYFTVQLPCITVRPKWLFYLSRGRRRAVPSK